MTRARLVCSLAGAALALATLAWPAPARAADTDDVAVARGAYDRGARAYNAGKYALAAREFSAADELAPNAVALRFALQAALKLDDPVLGMRLVERASVRDDALLASIARDARERFAKRVGRISLACAADAPCRARVDGEPVKSAAWVTPGTHAIDWDPGGRASVRVDAGESVSIAPPKIAQSGAASGGAAGDGSGSSASGSSGSSGSRAVPPSGENADRGVSPVFFWVGLGLTTLGIGATVGSGVDTLHQHDVFEQHPSTVTQHDGQAAQLRTNIFLGVTAALAVGTAAVGLFAVRWTHDGKTTASLALRSHGPGLAVVFAH